MYQIARAGFSASTRRKKRETIDDYVTIFNLLADHGADFEKKSEEGWFHCTRGGDSPLHEAIFRKNDAFLEELMKRRASFSILTVLTSENYLFQQRQPIHEAGLAGNSRALSVLVDNGVDIDTKDATGTTAAIYASDEGHFETVEVLPGLVCFSLL